ncbi:hypothetical protein BJX68DRAFT_260967 [Aspergillus pseudodeflectus]|uniref:Uncharacterized protein n=1 Tax=Aspergillus pseudodeflectus TaxID=176178 RepID=A0ABR4LCA8_9EURO
MAAQQFEVEVHGTKRPAEGELDDQPLAKKFGGLRIGPLAMVRSPERRQEQPRLIPKPNGFDDAMMLDDTKHTVYIHDLEQELEEPLFLQDGLTILPGLSDRLSMPKLLVSSAKPECKEVVLYREPESLSIPKDKDQVRRALIETRERARLGQSKDRRDVDEGKEGQVAGQLEKSSKSDYEQFGNDIMDIDTEAGT